MADPQEKTVSKETPKAVNRETEHDNRGYILTIDKLPDRVRPIAVRLLQQVTTLSDRSAEIYRSTVGKVEKVQQAMVKGQIQLSQAEESDVEIPEKELIGLGTEIKVLDKQYEQLLSGRIPKGLERVRNGSKTIADRIDELKILINTKKRQEMKRGALTYAVNKFNSRRWELFQRVSKTTKTPESGDFVKDISADDKTDNEHEQVASNYDVATKKIVELKRVLSQIKRLRKMGATASHSTELTANSQTGQLEVRGDSLGNLIEGIFSKAEGTHPEFIAWIKKECDQKTLDFLLNRLEFGFNATMDVCDLATNKIDNAVGTSSNNYGQDKNAYYTQEVAKSCEQISFGAINLSDRIVSLGVLKERPARYFAAVAVQNRMVKAVDVNRRIGTSESVFTHVFASPLGDLTGFGSIMKTGMLLSHRSAVEHDVPIKFVTGTQGSSTADYVFQKDGVIKRDPNASVKNKFMPWGQIDDSDMHKPRRVFHEFDQVLVMQDAFYNERSRATKVNHSGWALVFPARRIEANFQYGHESDGISIFDPEYDSSKTTDIDQKRGFPPGLKGCTIDLNKIEYVICADRRAQPYIENWIADNQGSLPGRKDNESVDEWKARHLVFVDSYYDEGIQRSREALFSRFNIPKFVGVEVPTGNKADSPEGAGDLNVFTYRVSQAVE